MTHWDITGPQTLDLGNLDDHDDAGPVRVLHLRVVAGDVSVTATDGPARLEVHRLTGEPLRVELADGVLTVAYQDLSWGGILGWLAKGRQRREVSLALAVPPACEVHLGTVSADAVVSGVTEPTTVRTVSGEITLDSLGGGICARTVSGNVESLSLAGDLTFETVSGDLTVGSGSCSRLSATTVSGDVMASVDVRTGGRVDVKTVSGRVVLRLPAGPTGAEVGVESVSGRLTSTITGVSTTTAPGRRRLRGSFGDGTGELRVKTVSGDVDLLAAPS